MKRPENLSLTAYWEANSSEERTETVNKAFAYIADLEQKLALDNVIKWIAPTSRPKEYQTVLIGVHTSYGKKWTMPAYYMEGRFMETTTREDFINIEQNEIVAWAAIPAQYVL